MSASTSAAPVAAPAKSKKLIVIGAVVALLLVVVAAAVLFLVNRSSGDDEDGDQASAAVTVPTFLPLENMVVNLADQGGDRFAQIGITLELQDEKTAGLVKQFMPSIRNGVLMLVSQRTAEELLQREGKEKLAADIQAEVARPLGAAGRPARVSEDDEELDRPRRRSSPVRRVLFSSFIIQ